ncbi:hypothetical protein ASPBRDRAFT_665831 [Aspergillus brasiliensis CBS 101740]|uniref:Uncharacterized protein n=1 Tax=Aspergillus brasiliensis (strain CBS 101740 / IMI 381727 / IBT 21946) TaxID=767769 RepID=A0A1L9U3Q9_ASPBC|nr:hypothetical protein ASPBRDRAFT_665831 [Aspergillus brasiliensis CBS 101740]
MRPMDRWQRAIPLHRSILRVAAQPALKGIQARCLSVICFECNDTMEFLNPDARSLVGVFCDLLIDDFRESDIVRLDTHGTFEDYADFFLDKLSDDALLILSLVTWHFDASLHNLSTTLLPPPSLLLHFILSGNDEELCEILWDNYTQSSGRETSLEAFTTKFKRLIGLITEGFLLCFLGPP